MTTLARAEANKPPVPTLAFAILAILARGPSTGYEISAQLRDPIGLFWQAGHSQVYPVLARIERLGWATASSSPGPGPRERKHYTITPNGLAALRDWVGRPHGRGRRDELLLRVYASWVADPAVVRDVLAEAEAHHAGQLATYLERRAANRRRGGPAPPGTAEFADYATLRRGIGFERGRLAWVRWLIAQLDSPNGGSR